MNKKEIIHFPFKNRYTFFDSLMKSYHFIVLSNRNSLLFYCSYLIVLFYQFIIQNTTVTT